jgi:hypothetical protein
MFLIMLIKQIIMNRKTDLIEIIQHTPFPHALLDFLAHALPLFVIHVWTDEQERKKKKTST